MANRIVAQFWDPDNENSLPVNEAAYHTLTAQYFKSLHAFLMCLHLVQDAPDRVAWESPILGMRIEMEMPQWDAIGQLAQQKITATQFHETVAALDLSYDPANQNGHNGDGLYLYP